MKYQFYAIIYDVAGNTTPVGSSTSPAKSFVTNIQKVTGISISPNGSVTKNIGESFTISATITPTDANNKTINWDSSNKTIATVDSNGKVTCLAAGDTTISAKAADGSGISAILTLTVKSPLVAIALNKSNVGIPLNGATTITATTTPSNANASLLNWTTSDSSIASIVVNGKTVTVTGMSRGTATITVQSKNDNTVKATCKVSVETLLTQISNDNYGDYVDYGINITAPDNKIGGNSTSGGTETPKTDWRIFYKDSTNVYLISANYLPNNKVPTSLGYSKTGTYAVSLSTSTATPTLSHKDNFLFSNLTNISASSTGYKAISTLLDSDKWNALKNEYADAVIGTPTLEMYAASWNEKYPSQSLNYNYIGSSATIDITGISNDDSGVPTASGWKNSLYRPHISYNWGSVFGNWFATTNGTSIPALGCHFWTSESYTTSRLSLRPVVMLKSTVCAYKDSNEVWQLSN